MLHNLIFRSTAAIGGTPFRSNLCSALGSAGHRAGAGADRGGGLSADPGIRGV